MADPQRSGVLTAADGSVERWNPGRGRWERAPGAAPAQSAAAPTARPSVSIAPPAAAAAASSRPAAPRRHRRTYAAVRAGRNSLGFASSGSSSADAELASSLARLRSGSRQMVRDSAYARRAKKIVVNNVIGPGMGMQAQVMNGRGEPRDAINRAIEQAFGAWCVAENCHTGGALHLHDLERAALGQVFDAGEVLVRMHYATFGASRVPLGLELIEAERLPDSIVEPGAANAEGEVRMGVEVDRFGRALAYWIRERHPGDIRSRVGGSERYERVPASDVFHVRIVDRWPQTRGEPWLHAVLRKIDDLNEVSGAELQAVRASSYFFGTIETPEAEPHGDEVDEATGQSVMDIDPLTVQQLNPGEKFQFHAPSRPNAELDAFMRHIVRELAAGTDVSYGSLSRDRSQGTYSSERQDMLEDRDNWRVLQQWWIRTFRAPLHRRWLMQAVLAGAVPGLTVEQFFGDPDKFSAVRFKPRGWGWVDPTKEVKAYKEAIAGGMTTLTDVIAQTADGRDFDDVLETRKRELAQLAKAGIDVDTTFRPAAAAPAPAPAGSAPDGEDDDKDDATARPRGARVVPIAR